ANRTSSPRQSGGGTGGSPRSKMARRPGGPGSSTSAPRSSWNRVRSCPASRPSSVANCCAASDTSGAPTTAPTNSGGPWGDIDRESGLVTQAALAGAQVATAALALRERAVAKAEIGGRHGLLGEHRRRRAAGSVEAIPAEAGRRCRSATGDERARGAGGGAGGGGGDAQPPAAHLEAVEASDGLGRLGALAELGKREASCLAGHAVLADANPHHRVYLGENRADLILGSAERKISNEDRGRNGCLLYSTDGRVCVPRSGRDGSSSRCDTEPPQPGIVVHQRTDGRIPSGRGAQRRMLFNSARRTDDRTPSHSATAGAKCQP